MILEKIKKPNDIHKVSLEDFPRLAPIGSAGQTTASRMDKYAPDLLDLGLKGMIGKGKRSR